MEIGNIIESDGVKRVVTGFTLVAGEMYPNTEPYTEPEIIDEPTAESELKCRYCGKVCKNALGLASHEEHCKLKGGEE